MLLQVPAIITKGYQVASGNSDRDRLFNQQGGTIGVQALEFKKRGLDFDLYFEGKAVYATLNLTIAPYQVYIRDPTYVFKSVRWTDRLDRPGRPPYVENFFLDPATIITDNIRYKALLYIPDPETKLVAEMPTRLEVIAERIPKIAYGEIVVLEYDDKAIGLY